MPKCAVVLSEEGVSSFNLNIDQNQNVCYFEKNTISQLNANDFDMVLFAGNDIDKFINFTELFRVVRECLYPNQQLIGFAGNCCNILSLCRESRDTNRKIPMPLYGSNSSEFMKAKYIQPPGIKYTIDEQNCIIQFETTCTTKMSDMIDMMRMYMEVDMDINIKKYKNWDYDEPYSLLDAQAAAHNIPNDFLIAINNSQYFISRVFDSSEIDENEFFNHLRRINSSKGKELTRKQTEYIQETFIAQCIDVGIYDILLTNLDESNMYLIQIKNESENCYFKIKSEFGDGNDYFVVHCHPFSDKLSMNILNYNIIPTKSGYYDTLIKPHILNFESPLLSNVVKKYRQQIQDVINQNKFFEYYI